MSKRVPARHPGAARFKWGPGKSQARRPCQSVDSLIPILSNTQAELNSLRNSPRIQEVSRHFGIADVKQGRRGKQRLRNQLTGKPKDFVTGAPKIGVVMQPIGVGAHLELMRSGKVKFRQEG